MTKSLRKSEVEGSNPFISIDFWTIFIAHSNSDLYGSERCVRDAEVAGSNPVVPIK